ncbi:hypothetical protein QFC21_004152 [Naganishia friedmannii]|uniref:Uncharacterized protein n=1 Tax=Naganishia friedmannii TaxID=89922 RepID=A0ACC2VKF2_9TREE|nr:hypothetical protein QFC21_004152 [Naganishia friedmannii]
MKDLDLLPAHILSPGQAHLGVLALTFSYVGSLYLTKPGTKRQRSRTASPETTNASAALGDIISQDEYAEQTDLETSEQFEEPLHRDHPVVIKSRIRAVFAATVVGCVGVGAVVGRFWANSGQIWTCRFVINATSTLLGFTARASPPFPTRHSPLPYILAPLLFIGPLYTTYLDKALPFQQFGRASLGLGSSTRNDGMLDCLRVFWTRGGDEVDPVERMKSRNLQRRRWIELRNCVAGPVSEEIVFRSCIIAIYQLSEFSNQFLVFVSPLWFGVAHLHHAYDVFVKGGRTRQAAIQATVTSLFQLTYTTLFGWFAAHLFTKTGSIWPPMIAHVFCNMMGFPNPSYTLQENPGHKGRE